MNLCQRLALSLVVLMTMVAATPAFAQQNARSSNSGSGGGVGFGVEFGLTRATIHAKDAGDFIKSRNGLMGGIWFGGNRNGAVGFMGEITYVVKGAKNEFSGEDLELHYLEIPAVLRDNIGLVAQETFLFSDTLHGNLTYGREDAPQELVQKAAVLAQAEEFIQPLEDGYETVVGERGVGLSGGQKQRASIARALMKEAPILILDDSTSSVDMET